MQNDFHIVEENNPDYRVYRYGAVDIWVPTKTLSKIEDIFSFSPFTKHLDQVSGEFPHAGVTITNLNMMQEKIQGIDLHVEYTNGDGSMGSYAYQAMPDFATTIALFKVAGAEIAKGRHVEDGYYVLSSIKPRPSMATQSFQGATAAGLIRSGEAVDEAAARKLDAETNGLVFPPPAFVVKALEDQPIVYSLTMKGNVEVCLFELDLKKKRDRAFWMMAQGREGGDRVVGERTRLSFVELRKFLTRGTTLPIRDGILTAAIALVDRDPALFQTVRKGIMSKIDVQNIKPA